MQQEKCQYQTIEQTHLGPFHRYMWKDQVGKWSQQQYGMLCKKCARQLGAWQLPEQKKEEVPSDSK